MGIARNPKPGGDQKLRGETLPSVRILPRFFWGNAPYLYAAPFLLGKSAVIRKSGLFLPRNTPKSRNPARFFRETRPNPKIQPISTEETHPNPVIRPTRLLLPRNGKDG